MEGTGIKPQVIEEICGLARKYGVNKVILFGSRARGDFRRTSDIDLAVEGGDIDRFSMDVNEETSTLLEYDIVNLDRDIQQELRDSIEKEGRVLYEKNENFCAALSNLQEIFNYEEPFDNVVLTGMVGLYELCFEQSWKMMKEILENHGYEEGATGSPKIILKTAYKAGMIKNEEMWLRALQERNNVAHSYNQKIALGIVEYCASLGEIYDIVIEDMDRQARGLNG